MIDFLWGAIATLCAIAALFFVKFWRQTRDGLFVGFALGFGTLALHWTALAVIHPTSETRHYVFWLRLLAFVFILGAVVLKNTTAPPGPSGSGQRAGGA
jgi:hypothetical protein